MRKVWGGGTSRMWLWAHRNGPELLFICRKAAYTSRPKDTSALFRHKFRIHIDHLSCPDVDESAIGSSKVVYGRGQ